MRSARHFIERRSSVFVGVNPLYEDPIPPAEDVEEESKESQPLLQRMKKVESIIEEEGRAVRAKVESVETKMGEDTRLLRSHMSNLEQDNSTLREENKAFKSRLDTLERKLS